MAVQVVSKAESVSRVEKAELNGVEGFFFAIGVSERVFIDKPSADRIARLILFDEDDPIPEM